MTSNEPLSPVTVLNALDVIREGHDGSWVGLFLTDLGGAWEQYKNIPTLLGIFSDEGMHDLDDAMSSHNHVIHSLFKVWRR